MSILLLYALAYRIVYISRHCIVSLSNQTRNYGDGVVLRVGRSGAEHLADARPWNRIDRSMAHLTIS